MNTDCLCLYRKISPKEELVVVEVKAIKALLPEHEAQPLNYLRAGNFKVGLMVNFGKSKIEWRRLIL